MKHINTLKREARQACEWRGHDMKYFDTLVRPNPLMGIKGTVARSTCRKCGREVQVETRPSSNYCGFITPSRQLIEGEAVAGNCEG